MRFSFKVKVLVTYSDIVGTLSLLVTITGLFL